jgi:pimeloyl-ACP methyl ester carboxylesterase
VATARESQLIPFDMPASGRMLTLAGLPTYVEESGRGPTLYYLHGATEWIGYAEEFTGLLARRFRVIQAERRGHGRSPDVPGPLTYAAMTADTIALMEHYGDVPAHLVGFSDGGIIALLLAMARPELVASVVAIGANVRVDGLTDETLRELAGATPENWPAEYRDAHARLSPDGPEHWPVFCQKVIDMVLREPNLANADLAQVTAPTLLVGGDRDAIRLEHFVEMHRAIAGSQLCILPCAPHEITAEQPKPAFEVTARFLVNEQARNH